MNKTKIITLRLSEKEIQFLKILKDIYKDSGMELSQGAIIRKCINDTIVQEINQTVDLRYYRAYEKLLHGIKD